MSRYCSDAIAIAKVAAMTSSKRRFEPTYELDAKFGVCMLDAAERELRHNINHVEVPPDCSNETFGVEPVRKDHAK